MESFTADLGRFVAESTFDVLPEEACRTAKTGFADCIAVMIAGANEPVVQIVSRELAGSPNTDRASLIPSGKPCNVRDVALVNGVAAHVLDYDDVALDGHPSAVLVPAILAQAEASRASGREMLAAYVAGYEVWAELLTRVPGHLHDRGWHPTAVLGTVAAAAACARLRRLDAARAAAALGAAASMAAGLVANFGTMTKSFQVGRTAQSGVIAARLAEAGLTAAPDALEHRAGFFSAFSPCGAPDPAPLTAMWREWQIIKQGLNLKRYPLCYATHRAIDAVLDLVETHGLRPNDIEQIDVSTGKTQMLMLRNSRPQTGLEAKFSMQFAMAASVVARKVGLSELTDEFVRRQDVQALMARVSCETTTETMPDLPFAPFDSVKIIRTGGDSLTSAKIERARGSHQRPLSSQELWAKFDDCVGEEFTTPAKTATFENLLTLERVDSVSSLGLTRIYG